MLVDVVRAMARLSGAAPLVPLPSSGSSVTTPFVGIKVQPLGGPPEFRYSLTFSFRDLLLALLLLLNEAGVTARSNLHVACS